jgi:hypothetical protein
VTATGVGGEPATTSSDSDCHIQRYVTPDSPFPVVSSLLSGKHGVIWSHIPLSSDLFTPLPSTCALKSLLRHLLVNSAELRAMVTAAAGSSGAARATRRVVPTIDIETSFWTRWLRWRHAEGIGSSRARLVAHLVHQCLWLVFQCLQLFISQHVSVFSLLASSAN